MTTPPCVSGGPTNPSIEPDRIHVEDLVDLLVSHELYAHVRNEASLRTFMRAHVFCVWDFQTLVTALQRKFTCVELPWLPTDDPEARRLINEIVLDEESDEDGRGGHLSHFELYLMAMKDCGADREPIDRFLANLRSGCSLEDALAHPLVPPGVASFVKATIDVALSARRHLIIAAFACGREEIIPKMFRQLVRTLDHDAPEHWSRFKFYLERHVERDSTRHGPLSRALLARECGQDELLWTEAGATARAALESRLALWDAILTTLKDAR